LFNPLLAIAYRRAIPGGQLRPENRQPLRHEDTAAHAHLLLLKNLLHFLLKLYAPVIFYHP